MSIFDEKRDPLNIPFPTAGGKVFWDKLAARGGFVLQRHILTGHCRILDENNFRVAWGEEGPMRAKLEKLAPRAKISGPQYGDVIGVHRIGGLYDHYGIYENDHCIYEYAAQDGDFGSADIHITTLQNFVRDSNNLFVLIFPENYGRPGKVSVNPPIQSAIAGSFSGISIAIELYTVLSSKDYHLYPPAETIRRAKSKLGETKYNLLFNNCEHYAIWCKTGLHKSHQVESLLSFISANRFPFPL